MTKEMLINMASGQECRIAIVDEGKLEELYIERASSASRVTNIYKARITNVEPAIQAAFVDFGLSRNGFLHISDVHPRYFPKGEKDFLERVGRKHAHRQRPAIQDCLHRGQELVVQMTKEGIGTKGPTMTTYLSIPGRLLVMMPGMSRLGVTRKIEDPEARDKARQILNELKLPDDVGFILRTAGIGQSKRELQRDLKFLTRLWNSVKQRIENSKAPAEIYQESDLVIRTIRDVYNMNMKRIICDEESVARKVQEFLDLVMPRTRHNIELYAGKEGLFHDYGLEEEINKFYARTVTLPSGGSLVIDQTEALVAIDVNSGRFREHSDAEMTAAKINQEASKEIARQLRLRDMGGVIVIDFIDMREQKNRSAVEKALRDALKADRAKTKILRISNLGIVEMTRQRIRPSLKDSVCRRCTYCDGTGLIKSEESQALMVMRSLQRATSNDEVAQVQVTVTPSVAHHLANYQRKQISKLETRTQKAVIIRADPDLPGDELHIRCTNARGSEVAWQHTALAKPGKHKVQTVLLGPLEKRKEQPPSSKVPELRAAKEEPTEKEEALKKAKRPRRRGRRGGRKHKKRIAQPIEAKEELKAERKVKAAGEKAPKHHVKRKSAEEEKRQPPTAEKKTKARRPRRRRAKKKATSSTD